MAEFHPSRYPFLAEAFPLPARLAGDDLTPILDPEYAKPPPTYVEHAQLLGQQPTPPPEYYELEAPRRPKVKFLTYILRQTVEQPLTSGQLIELVYPEEVALARAHSTRHATNLELRRLITAVTRHLTGATLPRQLDNHDLRLQRGRPCRNSPAENAPKKGGIYFNRVVATAKRYRLGVQSGDELQIDWELPIEPRPE